MTFDSKIINNILDKLFPLPEQFGVIVSEYDESEPINFYEIECAVKEIDPNAYINYGMSKLVIVSPKIGEVVIKIPFNGYYLEDEETGELEWCPFEWASGTDASDYCLTEYEKYERLQTYNLDCFVAKTIFYKVRCGIRIFLQELVIPESESLCSPKASKNSKDLAKEWKDKGIFHIDSEWIANCLDKYGKSKVERFLHYCSNLDLDILEDVHRGNFGYRKNGEPCMLDFSNYED